MKKTLSMLILYRSSTYLATLLLTLLYAFSALSAQAQTQPSLYLQPSPKHEVRAVWLTTIGGIDWPNSYANGSTESIERQQRELTTILDQLKAVGTNVVLLQTRVRATTIYPSRLEPWDGCLSGNPGKSPGYDALQFAIDECHKRGMQLHAWVVTIPVGKWTSAGCTQLRKHYPRLIKKIGQDGYMDPENIQTGTYLADFCEEIVRNYDVDGIHLDYIRYPETWKIKVSRAQGRRNITAIATAISQRVKRLKPWVMMSCSPIGKADDLRRYSSRGWNARTVVCQDAQEWLRTGVMDALFPMMYFRDNNFYPFAIDWQEQSFGRIVAPGLGTYMLNRHEGNWPLNVVTQELNVLRSLGLGHTHFRSKFLTDNTKGIYDFAKRFNQTPAVVPPMTWLSSVLPDTPKHFASQKNTDGTVTLSWQSEEASPRSTLYNIYASRTWPVDIDDARNIITTRLTDSYITLTPKGNFFYAVTAVDRYGNESKPLQSVEREMPSRGRGMNIAASADLRKCDGKRLTLPENPSTLDAGAVCIETMQGKLVTSLPYVGKFADVSKVPEGFYQLRSVNKKGVTHRLGFFMIKRR